MIAAFLAFKMLRVAFCCTASASSTDSGSRFQIVAERPAITSGLPVMEREGGIPVIVFGVWARAIVAIVRTS